MVSYPQSTLPGIFLVALGDTLHFNVNNIVSNCDFVFKKKKKKKEEREIERIYANTTSKKRRRKKHSKPQLYQPFDFWKFEKGVLGSLWFWSLKYEVGSNLVP